MPSVFEAVENPRNPNEGEWQGCFGNACGRSRREYAVVVATNYFAFILGLATALSAIGLEYHLSRIVAGLCEAAYMYVALRWVVFRE